MHWILHETRYAARALARTRSLSILAALVIGLGTAAGAVIFSVVHGVLLRPLPYRSPQQLVFVWDCLEWAGIPRAWVTPPQVADLRAETALFEGFAALRTGAVELMAAEDPQELHAGFGSANLFRLLGVRPALGRGFLPGDDQPGAPRVAVLSEETWRRHFGGDPGIVGTTILLDAEPTLVVGILPEEFNLLVHASLGSPQGVDLWQPLRADLASGSRGDHSLAVLARIRDGVSSAQAQSELDAAGRRQDQRWFGSNGFRFVAVPLREDLVSDVRPMLLMLLGAVGLVMLIASSNVAALLIARSHRRRRDRAIRHALGAGQGRKAIQPLTEAAILSLLGAVLGLAVAYLVTDLAVALAPEGLPRRHEIAIDARTLLFVAATAIGTTVLCAGVPALAAARAGTMDVLRQEDRGLGRGRRAMLRNAIVAGEIALSVVLLSGAGMLIRSFMAVQRTDPGFARHGALLFDLRLPASRYPGERDRRMFLSELLLRLEHLPGVTAVGAASGVPLSAGASQIDVKPDAGPDMAAFMADYMMATPDYFAAMGIDLVAGRGFSPDDGPNAPRVAVIDESLARHWPGGDAVGRGLSLGGSVWRVVGVARHARLYSLYADGRPQVYLPFTRVAARSFSVVVRRVEDPLQVAGAVREVLRELDGSQPLTNMTTVARVVRDSTSDQRLATLVMLGFAAMATLLAALGIYGILSHNIEEGRQEIGIRMALGAGRTHTICRILLHGLKLAAAGLAVGVLGAVTIGRLSSAFLYGTSPVDPATLIGVAGAMLAVALVASYLPARHAAATDLAKILKGPY